MNNKFLSESSQLRLKIHTENGYVTESYSLSETTQVGFMRQMKIGLSRQASTIEKIQVGFLKIESLNYF